MSSMVAQLPPEMQHLAAFYGNNSPDLGGAAAAGINTFAHNRISIKASKWRLVDVQGEEQFVNAMHLDVIFVDANPHISKIYYSGSYDPSADESAAPVCWSDNGLAPSDRATSPQCGTCAACPWNVVGSKISAANKPVKACSDAKKLAVILADNPTGPVYELRVPPASLKNMANAFKVYNQRDVRIETLVFRLTFEMEADYPKILFNALSYISPEQAPIVKKLLGSAACAEIVSKDDKPRQAALAAPAPAPQAALPAQPAYAPPAPAPQAALPAQPAYAPPAAPVMPPMPAAAYSAPTPQTMAPGGPPAFVAPHIVGVQPIAGPGMETPAPAKKTRAKKQPDVPTSPMVAGGPPAMPPMALPIMPQATMMPPASPPVFTPPTPAFSAPQPQTIDVPGAASASASVMTSPQTTNAELDSLINGINL